MTSVEMAGEGPASSRSLCVSSVWGSMSPQALFPDGPFHVVLQDAKLPAPSQGAEPARRGVFGTARLYPSRCRQ